MAASCGFTDNSVQRRKDTHVRPLRLLARMEERRDNECVQRNTLFTSPIFLSPNFCRAFNMSRNYVCFVIKNTILIFSHGYRLQEGGPAHPQHLAFIIPPAKKVWLFGDGGPMCHTVSAIDMMEGV